MGAHPHDTKHDVAPTPLHPCSCRDPRDGDAMFLAILLASLLAFALVSVRSCDCSPEPQTVGAE